MGSHNSYSATVRGYSVQRIAQEGEFPDWLGHLGVLLRYTEDAEQDHPAITSELGPQLTALVTAAGTNSW